MDLALPLWNAIGQDASSLGFHEALGMDGRPVPGPRRLETQARQIAAFADAGQSGWEGPWRPAVRRGLRAMFRDHHRRAGAFQTFVSHDTADPMISLSDQAHVLITLACVARVRSEGGRRDLANALLAGRVRAMRHPAGGFREPWADQPFQSDVHMTLLEAALAWEGVHRGGWRSLADEIVDMAVRRFIDPETGGMRAYFVEDWRPAPGPPGRWLNGGAQFQWAWLLERWALRRHDQAVGRMAARLHEVGRAGLDPARDLVAETLNDDLAIEDATARLETQARRLKAALTLSRRPDQEREPWLTEALSAARGLQRYFDTPVKGVWRTRCDARGVFVDEPAPASALYDIQAALLELKATTETFTGASADERQTTDRMEA